MAVDNEDIVIWFEIIMIVFLIENISHYSMINLLMVLCANSSTNTEY